MGEDEIGRDRLGASGDDFYQALMAAHEGLSFEESARLNAKLVLLLANAVGDLERLKAAIDAASLDGRIKVATENEDRLG